MDEPHEEKTDPRTYAVTRAPFRPEVDLARDPVYQELAENLTVRQIEFAKALVLTSGIQSQAVRMIQPEVSADSARNLGARLAKREGVMDLYRYLRQLPMADEAQGCIFPAVLRKPGRGAVTYWDEESSGVTRGHPRLHGASRVSSLTHRAKDIRRRSSRRGWTSSSAWARSVMSKGLGTHATGDG